MDTIELLNKRTSLRRFKDLDLTQEDLDLILNGAMRAPTAGNMMLYSIIVVKSKKKRKLLAKYCDNQPFIASAPVSLIFVADMQKLYDYLDYSNVLSFCHEQRKEFIKPNRSKLFLAAGDAFIAAQNAVVAAESIGVGSCYIGDIVENHDQVIDLLKLPKWTIPVAMLTLGYYPDDYNCNPKSRFDKKYIVFDEEYKSLKKADFSKMYDHINFSEDNDAGAKNLGQLLYARKLGSDFAIEMEESLKKYLDDWFEKE